MVYGLWLKGMSCIFNHIPARGLVLWVPQASKRGWLTLHVALAESSSRGCFSLNENDLDWLTRSVFPESGSFSCLIYLYSYKFTSILSEFHNRRHQHHYPRYYHRLHRNSANVHLERKDDETWTVLKPLPFIIWKGFRVVRNLTFCPKRDVTGKMS